jgi:hypothetical protein
VRPPSAAVYMTALMPERKPADSKQRSGRPHLSVTVDGTVNSAQVSLAHVTASRSNRDTWPSGTGGGLATIIALARSPGSAVLHLASRA